MILFNNVSSHVADLLSFYISFSYRNFWDLRYIETSLIKYMKKLVDEHNI